MNHLFLDGKTQSFTGGETILEIAGRAGIRIPTLCHSPITQSGGRCMVCAVRDQETGAFIPACTYRATPGLKIVASSPEVAAFRRCAVELLLSEHRGDCIAPCRLVCPQNLDIPFFMAAQAGFSPSTEPFLFSPEICLKCGGRCEKACRRGRIDTPIRISELLNAAGKTHSETIPSPGIEPSYRHYLGRITRDETMQYFGLPTSTPCPESHGLDTASLHKEKIKSPPAILTEAERCLQCTCSAHSTCELRTVASETKAQQHRFSGAYFPAPILFIGETLLFQPGKCIRCLRCIALGDRLNPGHGPVMTGRGRSTIPDGPIGKNLSQAFRGHEDAFCAECPTGAIFRRKTLRTVED
jgi:predicted molibdopterin-dependent oxidoreductase YjgC